MFLDVLISPRPEPLAHKGEGPTRGTAGRPSEPRHFVKRCFGQAGAAR